MVRVRLSLIALSIAALAACGGGKGQGSIEVSNCEPALKLSACTWDNRLLYCTFENIAQGPFTGRVGAWGYTKDGVQLGSASSLAQVAPLNPGQKKREMTASFFEEMPSKVVICSMDPSSPLVKGRIVAAEK